MLQNQLSNYEEATKELGRACQQKINAQQREINLEFVPVIGEAMEPARDTCTNERGRSTNCAAKAYCGVAVTDLTIQVLANLSG